MNSREFGADGFGGCTGCSGPRKYLGGRNWYRAFVLPLVFEGDEAEIFLLGSATGFLRVAYPLRPNEAAGNGERPKTGFAAASKDMAGVRRTIARRRIPRRRVNDGGGKS